MFRDAMHYAYMYKPEACARVENLDFIHGRLKRLLLAPFAHSAVSVCGNFVHGQIRPTLRVVSFRTRARHRPVPTISHCHRVHTCHGNNRSLMPAPRASSLDSLVACSNCNEHTRTALHDSHLHLLDHLGQFIALALKVDRAGVHDLVAYPGKTVWSAFGLPKGGRGRNQGRREHTAACPGKCRAWRDIGS